MFGTHRKHSEDSSINRNPPSLISLCGIDGCGKSTQASRLPAALRPFGVDAVSKKISTHALKTIFSLTEAHVGNPFAYEDLIPVDIREFAVASDVLQSYRTTIDPTLESGKSVISDRGKMCYLAYAKAYKAQSPWIWEIYKLIRTADITIYLDIDPNEAIRRIQRREGQPLQPDESHAHLTRVRSEYLDLISTWPGQVSVVDANQPISEVSKSIDKVLQEFILSKSAR